MKTYRIDSTIKGGATLTEYMSATCLEQAFTKFNMLYPERSIRMISTAVKEKKNDNDEHGKS